MTKNLKKCVSLLRAGRPITEARFPTNYQTAMEKEGLETDEVEVASSILKGSAMGALYSDTPSVDLKLDELYPEPMTEAEFADILHSPSVADYTTQAMTEAEFHQAHSVEKEQV